MYFRGGDCVLHIPANSGVIRKSYSFDDEFIPGGTSGSEEITAEVVYVGYGITAPELGYDDYAAGAGTGRTHQGTVADIRKDLKPRSFASGKTMTLKNVTEHHPDGVGVNVVGVIPGSDPRLKDEIILIGGHLDHLGRMWELMPGANDNATAVAVGLGIAEAMMRCEIKPKRTILFNFFGSEEQGVAGSKYYTENPIFPLDKTVVFINMEGPGVGDKISASGGTTYPAFWSFIEKANAKYIHRTLSTRPAAYPGRPRQDSAWFFWKGVPSLTFGAYGKPAPYPTYHNTRDTIGLVTPEIMEDVARLLFMAVMDMAGQPELEFRPKKGRSSDSLIPENPVSEVAGLT